jgi:predicted GNAT superfamily acetyltransferase
LDDFDACVVLQKETWGEQYTDIVPASLLKVSQKIGGILAGGFTGRGEMKGFVFGMTGVRDGNVVHWSHMLAVRKEMRGTGLGKRLKLFQREQLLSDGISQVQWTFDPLVARNANLNLNSLSATVSEYVTDMYGESGSELHSGVGMDRFIVNWNLNDPAVVRAAQGTKTGPGPQRSSPVVNTRMSSDGRVTLVDQDPVSEPEVQIEIPSDVETMLRRSVEEAVRWRVNTRGAFLRYMERGYRVEGFQADPNTKRSFYILKLYRQRSL